MKMLLFLIACCLPGYLNAQQAFSQAEFLKIVKGEKDAHSGKMIPATLSASADYDVKYYNCFWNIDPAVNFISGKVTTLFTPTQAAFDSIVFDLTDALTVDSVVYHNVSITFNHSLNLITTPLPGTIPVNTPDSITIYYHGVPGSTGFGSF
ncbi:MAG TPA: hypothetical protein PKD91_04825, partial [Bacteroidia bacterium]|nr:hypothetical protein [Bacteroidia bacterium]